MTAVLHRLGYVYKKPRLVPGKADREAQEQFLATYDHIRNSKGQDDPIEKRKIAKYTVFIEK